MNTRKMWILLIVLIVVYIAAQFAFQSASRGHFVEYKIKASDQKIEIAETYTQKKGEKKNYYLELKVNEVTFNFNTDYNFKKRNYIIKDIDYYQDEEYICLYPSFKTDVQLTDVLCSKNNTIYPYQSIKGQNSQLDQFVAQLENYDSSLFEQNTQDTLKKDTIMIYRKNLLKNHYLAIENYKGLALINQKDVYKTIPLFEKDKYKREVKAFVNNTYITADYDKEHTFNEFYVVDITTGKIKKIISNSALELDAYVMGTVDDKVYIFDKSNKEQYNVNVKKKTISRVGNTSSGIQIYQNGSFQTASAYDAYQKKMLFNPYSVTDTELSYQKLDKIAGETVGYYYGYEKVKNSYKVYRIAIQNKKIRTYLFETTDIQNIVYLEDTIYYRKGNDIYYYQDLAGSKLIATNTEFEFNETLNFSVYEK